MAEDAWISAEDLLDEPIVLGTSHKVIDHITRQCNNKNVDELKERMSAIELLARATLATDKVKYMERDFVDSVVSYYVMRRIVCNKLIPFINRPAESVYEHCSFCRKLGVMRTCQICKNVRYCNSDCERYHREEHRVVCNRVT